jgi:thioredoxin reductase
VAVIGSGEEALEDATHLTDLASKIFLVSNEPKFSVSKDSLKRLNEKENVTLLEGYKAQSIEGEQLVKTLRLRQIIDGKEKNLKVEGVFIAVGVVPMTEIIKRTGVNIDKRGCILVDRKQATNLLGIFAAGDCTCGGMQIATAVGEGAMAAISASRIVK